MVRFRWQQILWKIKNMIQRKHQTTYRWNRSAVLSVFDLWKLLFIVLSCFAFFSFPPRVIFYSVHFFSPMPPWADHNVMILFLLNTRSKLIIKLNSVILTNLILKSTGYFLRLSQKDIWSMTQLGNEKVSLIWKKRKTGSCFLWKIHTQSLSWLDFLVNIKITNQTTCWATLISLKPYCQKNGKWEIVTCK